MGKITARFDPGTLRCPSRSKAGWCYKVVAAGPKKGFIVQYRAREGLLIVGHLGPGCRMVYGGKKASVFKTRQAADQVAQKCILFARNPAGKDPERIYKVARQ